MVLKCSAASLVVLALLAGLGHAQYYGQQKPSNPPKRPTQQEKQVFEKPFNWAYPSDPEPDAKPEGAFELRHPVPAATVAVECREQAAHVEVKKDLFGIGQYINPADLTLGNCAVSAEDPVAQVLIFEAPLQDCGSTLMMTDSSLIYTYTLDYDPQPLGNSPVVRTSKAAVIVECHYPRRHNVSSQALDPIWVPYSAVKMAEEFLYFGLTIMTADWLFRRPSHQYYLGDVISIEASVNQYHHAPLRVFVDRCVATLTPDANSNPSYIFIDDGCMLDGRLTTSGSRFNTRTKENRLQFTLDAFRFKGADSGVIYITCYLRAVSVAAGIDTSHRACSYINGWREANGHDSMCGSCDSTAANPSGGVGGGAGGAVGGGASWGTGSSHPTTGGQKRHQREAPKVQIPEWIGLVQTGPINIENKVAA